MNPVLETFDHIAIIHLADRTDRYRECLRELKILHLGIIPGKLDFFPGQRFQTLEGFPSLGARGDFYSQLDLIRQSLRDGVKTLLILEDDFEVSREGLTNLKETIALAHTHPWDFFYLGHRLDLPPTPTGLTDTKEPIVTSHAVAIRSAVFESLIEYLEGCIRRPPGDPIGGPQGIDGAFTMFRARNPQLTTLVATPILFDQRSSRSDITPHGLDEVPILRQVVGFVRQILNLFKQTVRFS